jgi:hypothetical protein
VEAATEACSRPAKPALTAGSSLRASLFVMPAVAISLPAADEMFVEYFAARAEIRCIH